MSFPAYPEHKESGVEWLGEVPVHWEVKPLKYVATYNDEVLPETTPDDHLINYVEISDVGEQSGITGCSEYTFAAAPSRARRILRDGDVLISTVRTYLRAIAPVIDPPENLVGSTGFAAIRPMAGQYYSGLLGYTLRAEWFISKVIAGSVGVSYPAINASDLVSLLLPVPPLKEQQAIAAFLDHETARIDALIAEQQRLIKLLKEKRQAVISHAVTKGLDPDAPMKDSGVEWLGDVPAHWEVCKLGYVCSLQGGYAFDSSGFSQDGVTIVRMNNLKRGRLDLESSVKVFPESCDSRFQLTEGDILYGMSGSVGETGSLGNYAIVSRDDLPAQLNQRVGRFVLERLLLSNYLELVAQSLSFYAQVLDQVTGTAQFNVSSDQVESCKITFPGIEEQIRIAKETQAELIKMDRLVKLAEDQVYYLQERRSALISAAVTGKIDVRGWQTEPEATPMAAGTLPHTHDRVS